MRRKKPQRDPQWRRIASACRSPTLFARLSAMKVRSHWNLLNIYIVHSLGLGTVPIQMPNNFGKDLRIGQAIRAICTYDHGYFGNWWKCLHRHASGKTCYVSANTDSFSLKNVSTFNPLLESSLNVRPHFHSRGFCYASFCTSQIRLINSKFNSIQFLIRFFEMKRVLYQRREPRLPRDPTD